MKEEVVELSGTVIDKQPNAFFKIQINETEHIVLATISGRMRRNRIRILMGDRVDVELSPYDLTRGRITYRHK
jgi:translation initiation factor IF-1